MSTSKKPRASKAAPPKKAVARKRAEKPVVPAQRRSEIDELGLRTEELVVAEHDARDARLFEALDWSAR